MIPFTQGDPEKLRKIEYILTDIDDTLTTEGKITKEAYTALWNLHDAGYKIIPVTGRPAGWCDLIIRQWPVDAIVGENGAFTFYFKDNQLHTFTHPSVQKDSKAKLQEIKQACLAGVPGCKVSKDQFCRMYDLAIDFNEDPPHLGFEAGEKIQQICESMGAVAKVSSIHVNAWFGEYDKVSMSKLFLQEVLGQTNIQDKVIFFGDSPNDEPMFKFFPNSCAVANIKPFLSQIQHRPSFITQEDAGKGFASAANFLLSLKK